jgi:hypothetical protein
LFSSLQATDDQRVELSESFYIGQSVRSNILDVGELLETEAFEIMTFEAVL